MSEDSSNNITTEPINTSPPSMETVEFLSYILSGESILNRDYRASPYNFVNNTNRPYIPMRRRRAVPSNIETYLDISSNETTTNIINDMSDNSTTLPNLNAEEDLYRRFLEDILQLPPLGGLGGRQQQSFRDLLRETLTLDKNPVKQVLSEEGEKCIEDVIFDSTIHTDTTCCPITMKEFKDGDVVAKLPCKHMFDKTAILKWLKEEKAECPICRAKLKSVEKKEEIVEEATQTQPHHTVHNLRRRRMPVNDNVRFSFGPPRLPQPGRAAHFRRLMQSRQERQESEELQAALLASLEDQYMPGNEKISSTEINSESDLSSSDEMDQID